MKDIELYTRILGIESPWEISKVDLSIEERRVDIYVVWPERTEADCPECLSEEQETCKIHDRRKERVWRHLDTCQMKTYIHCRIPRIKCPKHGVLSLKVPWAESKARFTQMFESFAIALLKGSQNRSKSSEILQISWDEMNQIMERGVKRGLSRRHEKTIHHIGIDEKSFLSGHSYVTVMTDIDGKRILDVTENRDETSVNNLWEVLTEEQRMNVKAVSIDFWKAYISGVQRHAPKADIVHDRFHISKYLNESVDKVRKEEHRKLKKSNNDNLTGTKYLWLKNRTNWTERDTRRFAVLSGKQLSVGRAWNRKELFQEFWLQESVEDAMAFFKRWYFSATHSRLKPIIDVAKMLKRHIGGLLTWIKHKISNGLSEGFNSRIQQIKMVARGFRSFRNYRVSILFYLGALDMNP